MITKKELYSMSNDQLVETVCFMKEYSKRPTKNGGSYLGGILEMQGSVDFKVWSGPLFDKMEKYDYANMVVAIKGKVNEFGGMKSLILQDVNAIEDGIYKPEEFFETRYDSSTYMNAFETVLAKNCSEEVKNIIVDIIKDVQDRFEVEFAARGHHDAVKGGLLAHTYKVVFLMSKVIKMYPNITSLCGQDILIAGCALHDIGKIYEYQNGVVCGNGLLVSHHTFGVEILLRYKDRIVSELGEDFFYRLLSVVEQHHGEYEETPRTVEAYLVHLVDFVETRFEIIEESFMNSDGERGVVSIETYKLN